MTRRRPVRCGKGVRIVQMLKCSNVEMLKTTWSQEREIRELLHIITIFLRVVTMK